MSPTSGQTPATLSVSVDPSGLTPDFYRGTIQVSSGSATRQLPVTLRVPAGPSPATLSVDPTTARVQWYSGLQTPPPQRIQAATDGGASTTVQLSSSVKSGPRWLSTRVSSLTAPGFFDIVVNPAGVDVGGYDGEVTLSSGGSVLLRIPVQLLVTDPESPIISVDADSLQMSAPLSGGGQVSQLTVKSPRSVHRSSSLL